MTVGPNEAVAPTALTPWGGITVSHFATIFSAAVLARALLPAVDSNAQHPQNEEAKRLGARGRHGRLWAQLGTLGVFAGSRVNAM